jgi:hypothetical protein
LDFRPLYQIPKGKKSEVTIKIPPENILDTFLKLLGKERKVIVPEAADKIYQKKGPYVQIKARRESSWEALFRIED